MLKLDNKLNILVACQPNPTMSPRPSRVINHLKSKYKLFAIGINATYIDGVEVSSIKSAKKRTYFEELVLYKNVLFKNYKALLEIPTRLKIRNYLKENSFDIIFCHDLVFLPFILENKKNAKVIFDAREYYPKESENNLRWNILFSGFNNWLCKTYLNNVDYIYTVSQGLADMYMKNYSVNCDVLMSYSKYYNLNCSSVNENKIRLIHHGVVSEDRAIHLMIEMMDFVDARFTLDLMLVKKQGAYYKKLENMVKQRKNVNIVDPVEFDNIIPFTNNYDIGLYILPPTNFNTKHALPNKFFEFIQARLMVVIGPSVEMANLVDKYKLGIIAKDFNPKSMAKELNKLNIEDITTYKCNSHKLADIFNLNYTNKQIDSIIESVLK